jgi:hypothetical protein
MDGLESLEDVMKDIEERPFIDEEFLMQQCMDSWAFALGTKSASVCVRAGWMRQ